MVAYTRKEVLSEGETSACVRGRWWKQRKPAARLEAPPAKAFGPTEDSHHRLPLSAGNQQVEQNRTSTIFVCQHELERSASRELRGGRQSYRQHQNPNWIEGKGHAGQELLRDGPEDQRRRDAGASTQSSPLPRQLELHSTTPTSSCPKTRTNSRPASARAFRIDASTLASPREAGMLGHEHADPTLDVLGRRGRGI